MDIFKLVGTIAINAGNAYGVMDDVGNKAAEFSEKMASDFKKIATTAAMVFSLDKLKDFASGCVEAYSTIAAESSAFTQIMGDFSDEAVGKLESVAEKTGIISGRLRPHMTSLTSRFMGLGLGIDQSTSLATQGLEMAADAAAAWDMTLDESMSHLNSFINGNYEGGEAIRLYANDTQMAQRAIEQGFISDKKEWAYLDEATKQMVRLNEARRQMEAGNVSGQSARESGAYLNQRQNLAQLWEETQAIIGKPFLEEIVLPVVQALAEFLQWCKDNPEALSKVFTDIGEALGTNITTFFEGAINIFEWFLEHEGALKAALAGIGLAFAGIAIYTHPILTALATIASFILWLAGEHDEHLEEYLSNMELDKSIAVQNAGKYSDWTDAQKEAARDYIGVYGAGHDTTDEVLAMQAAGLTQEQIDFFRADVTTALSEGDYSIMIDDVWFEDYTEDELQSVLDGYGLSVDVKANVVMDSLNEDFTNRVNSMSAPKHANGLDRVPYNEYPALLHRNEAVLTAAEASVWRSGNYGVDFSRLEAGIHQLAGLMQQVVNNTGAGNSIVLDSGALVGQLMPQIDSGLGVITARKRRG